MNAYVYCHVPSKTACASLERYAEPRPQGLAYCFDVPLEWVPQSQEGFEMMMKAKGYACGPSYEWNGLFS